MCHLDLAGNSLTSVVFDDSVISLCNSSEIAIPCSCNVIRRVQKIVCIFFLYSLLFIFIFYFCNFCDLESFFSQVVKALIILGLWGFQFL